MIATADSVTELNEVAGKVLVTGSHGGIVAAQYAATARVRAVIFHDAGLSKDDSGVAGLALLEGSGVAAAAVGHATARIGDAADCLARGMISRANRVAAAWGVTQAQPCSLAAVRLLAAPLVEVRLPAAEHGRYALADGVVGCDSVGLVEPADAQRILVIGSHASLHGGRRESALPVSASLAFFHEGGGDCSRLPALEACGVAAAAIERMSARIGDARSMWATGIVANCNALASAAGVRRGAAVQGAIAAFSAAQNR